MEWRGRQSLRFSLLALACLIYFSSCAGGGGADAPGKTPRTYGPLDRPPIIDEAHPSVAKIQFSPELAERNFGKAMSLSQDNRAVISGDGFAELYGQDESRNWVRVGEFEPSVATPDFGRSISMDDDKVAIGAVGKVFVYEDQGSNNWNENILGTPDGRPVNETFGSVVEIDGDRLAVGQTASGFAGATYIFNRDAGDWSLTAGYEGNSQEGCVGHRMDVSGDTVVIGDTNYVSRNDANQPLADTGQFCVYTFNGAGAYDFQILRSDYKVAGQKLGASIAVSGDIVIAGAPGVKRAFIYQSVSNEWVKEAELSVSNAAEFGSLVGLDGNTAVVSGKACRINYAGCAPELTLFIFAKGDDASWSMNRTIYLNHIGEDTSNSVLDFISNQILVSISGLLYVFRL